MIKASVDLFNRVYREEVSVVFQLPALSGLVYSYRGVELK
jgi:hypothetical protein